MYEDTLQLLIIMYVYESSFGKFHLFSKNVFNDQTLKLKSCVMRLIYTKFILLEEKCYECKRITL